MSPAPDKIQQDEQEDGSIPIEPINEEPGEPINEEPGEPIHEEPGEPINEDLEPIAQVRSAYIESVPTCKRDLMSRYSVWNYLENKNSSTGVELSACNATGIVMSAMTFLNTIIYYTILMTVLISLLFFSYDYMLVISEPIETIKVNLANKTFTDDTTKQPIQPLPYEIQHAGNVAPLTTQYVCGDKNQKWSETWMDQLGTANHRYQNLDKVSEQEQTRVLDNINCQKFYEKTKMCYVNPTDNNTTIVDAIHGIQNSTFYNEIPRSRVEQRLIHTGTSNANRRSTASNHLNNKQGMFSDQDGQCTDNAILLNIIDPDTNLCEKVQTTDSSFNKTIQTVKRVYWGFFSICVWCLIVKLVFNNYNYTLGENDMGWLNLFLVVYGVTMPLVMFFTLWKRPTLQYRAIDYFFGTTFHHKWKGKPYMSQTRNIVLTVSMMMVFIPIVIYMTTKSISRGLQFRKTKSRLSVDELLLFFVQHKKNPRNDGYILKSFAFVVFMGVIGAVTVQFIKIILSM